jgi:hypothetical protein
MCNTLASGVYMLDCEGGVWDEGGDWGLEGSGLVCEALVMGQEADEVHHAHFAHAAPEVFVGALRGAGRGGSVVGGDMGDEFSGFFDGLLGEGAELFPEAELRVVAAAEGFQCGSHRQGLGVLVQGRLAHRQVTNLPSMEKTGHTTQLNPLLLRCTCEIPPKSHASSSYSL